MKKKDHKKVGTKGRKKEGVTNKVTQSDHFNVAK